MLISTVKNGDSKLSEEAEDKKKALINLEHVNLLGPKSDEAVAGVIAALFGKPAHEAGDFVGDYIGKFSDEMRARRILNRNRILAETADILERRGVEMDEVALIDASDADVVLQTIASVTSPDLQGMWASLLANSLDPATGATMTRTFTGILDQLGPTEAAFLKGLREIEEADRIVQEFWHKRFSEGQALSAERLMQWDEEPQQPTKSESDTVLAMWANIREFVSSRKLFEGPLVVGATDNLSRLGLIKVDVQFQPGINFARPDLDLRGLAEQVDQIQNLLEALDNRMKAGNSAVVEEPTVAFQEAQTTLFGTDTQFTRVRSNFALTRFGGQLLDVCGEGASCR